MGKSICKADGCEKIAKCRGFCQFHYDRDRRPNTSSNPEMWINYGQIKGHPLKHPYVWIKRKCFVGKTKMCPEWKNDFRQFVKDVGERPGDDYKLQVINPEIGYYKGNTEWVKKIFKKESTQTEKEYRREYMKHYRKTRPENIRNTQLKRNFGIDLDQYDEMLKKQDHKCAICGKDDTFIGHNGKKSPLAVDHDHKTGKIRSLLCHKCNNGLGTFNDDVFLLQKAIDYLNHHKIIA